MKQCEARSGIITLITDFGLNDPYAGQLRGALLKAYRHVTIVDISHSIRRHDSIEAAVVLRSSYHHFPAGSVHLAVVDPGVGSTRSILAGQTSDSHYFIAPDNGILSLLFSDNLIQVLYRLEMPLPRGSATFQGRDIMAPAAGAIARGKELEQIGTPVSPADCVIKSSLQVEKKGGRIIGVIIRIDHFGNIRTSIRKRDVTGLQKKEMFINLGATRISGLSTTYNEQPPGSLCALIDSDGFLEIACNQGNAAKMLQAGIGEKITVSW